MGKRGDVEKREDNSEDFHYKDQPLSLLASSGPTYWIPNTLIQRVMRGRPPEGINLLLFFGCTLEIQQATLDTRPRYESYVQCFCT